MKSTSKRVLVSILLIVGFYTTYYYSPQIGAFLSNPLESLKNLFPSHREEPKGEENESPKQVGEKKKVVYVDESDAVVDVIGKASPSVVSIVRKEILFDPFNGPLRTENSIGTGFVVDPQKGIIFTNRHVVSSENVTYSVVVGDGEKTFDVEKIYRDPINDFAIIKIEADGESLSGLELGDSDRVKVGQTVVAIGNALGQFSNTATKGIVSGLGRFIHAKAGVFGPSEALENVIQTDAALNPGNSGGPLLDLSGKVIGINVAISQGGQNIGFAIPINSIKPVFEKFYETGKISRPYLGVEYSFIDKEMAMRAKVPVGAYIQRVIPDTPASEAGIKAGDIILRVNGIRLDDKKNSLRKVISTQEVGVEIPIVVQRENKEVMLKVKLKDLAD